MIDLDEEFKLNNIFWAEIQNKIAYELFGDIITFDKTYLTNAYKMHFVSFVGVNHYCQSIIFRCGLIFDEYTQTFEWLSKLWLKCMDDQPPNDIITDQDKIITIVISNVFPMSRYHSCL